MKDINKYRGIIPAFYACYAPDGSISIEGVKALTRHLIAKGVKGVYVGGSSGECIYQHPDERKAVLEAVMSEAKGKITVIAHVACNNTADSVELAAHAEKCGVDAIAAIPPIYFHLPNYAIADYWNAMSAAAPNTEFVIYNIPQLAGTALTMPLLQEMLKNPKVIAVKNSVAIHISTTHIACGSLHSVTIFISDFRQLTATFRTSHFYEMTVGIVLHLPSELTGIGSAGVVYGVAIFHIAIAVELQVQFGNIALVICHGDFCAVFRRICLRFGKEILEDGFFPILTYDTCHQSFFVLGDRHPGSRLR